MILDCHGGWVFLIVWSLEELMEWVAMSLTRAFGVAAIALAFAMSAGAQGDDLPLFTAFKTFCVNTRAEPGAVNAAVEAAGGKTHNPPGGSTEDGTLTGVPFPLWLASWDVTVGGHDMLVNAGAAYPSRKFGSAKHPVSDFVDCSIDSHMNEDASVAAIRDWVGLPPLSASTNSRTEKWAPDLTQYHYEFQMMGSKPTPITSQSEHAAAETDAQRWGLVLMRSPKSAALQLTRTLSTDVSKPD